MNRPAQIALAALALAPGLATAFCGFYVAQADADLFNQASEVVLVRGGNHTTMTMANDYRGPLSEFAVVIPVPVAVKKDQVRVGDMAMVDRLDAYSAPRLTEYFDPDPCPEPLPSAPSLAGLASKAPSRAAMDEEQAEKRTEADLGVRVEQTYTVGEYDIQILSAEYSAGLETWLTREGYHIPDGAGPILQSYIRQNMHFFVAKVNLHEARRSGSSFLRPLQISYDSPKFMLPIRLGMVNADGAQDLLVYAVTPKGRVETTNYRTIRLPSGEDVPEFVASDFGRFYTSLFARQVVSGRQETVFTEYAWPLTMNCDPCSADPVPPADLQALGANWVTDTNSYGTPAYLTRLHVRYDLAHFPEDLVFQETGDTQPWQAIYTIHHPFNGDTQCSAGQAYERSLAQRQDREVDNLSRLTGWSAASIWSRVPRRAQAAPTDGGGFWDWH